MRDLSSYISVSNPLIVLYPKRERILLLLYQVLIQLKTDSKLLGHSKITTTQIYARVIERKVSEDMQLLKDKINTKIGDSGFNSKIG